MIWQAETRTGAPLTHRAPSWRPWLDAVPRPRRCFESTDPGVLLLTTPFIASSIALRSHSKGNSDPTKSALQAVYRYLQPHLSVNLDRLDPKLEDAFRLTWARRSVLAQIQSSKLLFLPLPTSGQAAPVSRPAP